MSQRDNTNLFLLKKYLGCGRLKRRKDGCWIFVVENPNSLKERVIPFFKRFELLSSKAKTNFSLFCKIVDLIVGDKHLTETGLEQIALIREKLNEGRGRKRKFNLSDIQSLKESPETIRWNEYEFGRYSPILQATAGSGKFAGSKINWTVLK